MPLNCTRTYLQSSGQQLTQHDFCFFLNNKYIEPRAFHITIVMRINSMCNSLQAVVSCEVVPHVEISLEMVN